jgi:inhibitor of KinA
MTDADNVRIFPLGDSALTVEFGTVISEELNRKALALAQDVAADPFEGFIEAVPAYASTTIFYDIVKTRKAHADFPSTFAAVKHYATAHVNDLDHSALQKVPREIDIPVHFGGEAGPDLAILANFGGISEAEVIEIFTSQPYRVYMLGFLPGFSYMGQVDERIAMPRRDSPRKVVAKGSVGMAGRQTGIYSLESPGGWQIIGRTDIEMFTPAADDPTFLRPGDSVRFTVIK